LKSLVVDEALVCLKFDMHVHTNYSDSTGKIGEIFDVANKKGLDGIAITDHDTFEGVKAALKIKSNILVIPGEEIHTQKGEILAYGITEAIPPHLPLKETIHLVHKQKGLVFIPHPTVPLIGNYKHPEVQIANIDGLEVFTAMIPFADYYASKNIAIAKRRGLPMIAGSDSHNPETVGDSYTIINSKDPSIPSILQALRTGNTEIFCQSSPLKFKIKILTLILKMLTNRALNIFKS